MSWTIVRGKHAISLVMDIIDRASWGLFVLATFDSNEFGVGAGVGVLELSTCPTYSISIHLGPFCLSIGIRTHSDHEEQTDDDEQEVINSSALGW